MADYLWLRNEVMEPSKFNDHFVKFPYRRELRDDGDINNGGIDLIKEPHRIDEIHELKGAPWLRSFVSSVNSDNGLFMTFGCVYGPENDGNYGYVDFSLRPTTPVILRPDVQILDDLFYAYLEKAMQVMENPQQAIQYAKSTLVWERTPLLIYGETYEKVTLTFAYRETEGAAWLFEHLQYFLNMDYPLLPHVVQALTKE